MTPGPLLSKISFRNASRLQRRLTFLTNLMHLAVGTSENAVQVQLWIALIAMRLLKFLQLKPTWPWSLSNLAALLRCNLLTYRDLWAWLNAPFERPLSMPAPTQVRLFAS